jgi:hypothetical protein
MVKHVSLSKAAFPIVFFKICAYITHMNDIIHSDIIIAGENALVSLKDARDFLGHARNWGVVDIFGGGLLSSCMKYGDIREYRKKVKKAGKIHGLESIGVHYYSLI